MLRILRYVKGSNLQVANLLILCSKIATKNFRLLRIFFFLVCMHIENNPFLILYSMTLMVYCCNVHDNLLFHKTDVPLKDQ